MSSSGKTDGIKLFENKQLIHIVSEVVVLMGMTFYFSSKNKKLLGHIEELAQTVEQQEDRIQKLENSFVQFTEALNKTLEQHVMKITTQDSEINKLKDIIKNMHLNRKPVSKRRSQEEYIPENSEISPQKVTQRSPQRRSPQRVQRSVQRPAQRQEHSQVASQERSQEISQKSVQRPLERMQEHTQEHTQELPQVMVEEVEEDVCEPENTTTLDFLEPIFENIEENKNEIENDDEEISDSEISEELAELRGNE